MTKGVLHAFAGGPDGFGSDAAWPFCFCGGGATAAGADAVEGGLAVAARSRKASHEGLDYYQSGAARKGSAALKAPSTRKGSAGHAGGGRADVGDREASASDARDGGGGGGTSSTVLASPQVGLTAWDSGAEPHADGDPNCFS